MVTIFSSNQKTKQASVAKEMNKLTELEKRSSRIIYELSSVFPFDFFPSSVIIEEMKITIRDRYFFFSKETFPITYDNLNSVVVANSLFFSTMKFEITGYNENPAPITFLWNAEAAKARRIILGLIECHKEGIDLSQLDIDVVRKKVEEIGRAK